MNKTDVLVIDIGTIRHGHRDGIFSEWHSTYYITENTWLFQLTRVLLQLTRVSLDKDIDLSIERKRRAVTGRQSGVG